MGKRLALVAWCILLAGLALPAENRTALLVANGAYARFSSLANPIPEARELRRVLEGLGFTVTLVENASRSNLVDALADFEDALAAKGGTAFFHYGGHAVEEGGKNYLVPVDADIPDPRRIASRTVSLDEVMAAMEGKAAASVVVLDACRNNPLPAGSGRSASRGLALVAPPPNTAVIYSAQPGAVARDGLFTPILCRHLARPGLSLQEVLTEVRKEVFGQSAGAQTPGTYDQLFESLYLAGRPAKAGAALAAGPAWRWVNQPGQAPGPARAGALPSQQPVWPDGSHLAVAGGAVVYLGKAAQASGEANPGSDKDRLWLWKPGAATWQPAEPARLAAGQWQGSSLMSLGSGWVTSRSQAMMYSLVEANGTSGGGEMVFRLTLFDAKLKRTWRQDLSASADQGTTSLHLEQQDGQTIRLLSADNTTLVEEYDDQTGNSRILDLAQAGRWLLTQPLDYQVAVLGDRLYLVGMVQAPVSFGCYFPAFLAFDPARRGFTALKAGFSSRSGASLLAWNGSLVLAGGREVSGRPTDAVERYLPAQDAWKTSSLTVPRASPLLLVRDGRLYAAGGLDREGQPLPVLEVFDPVLETWQRLADLELPVSAASHLALGDILVSIQALPPAP